MATKKSSNTRRRQVFSVRGMTCRSCEIMIERKLRLIPGVTEVRVSERRGEAELFSRPDTPAPTWNAVAAALEGTPYTATLGANHPIHERTHETTRGGNRWFEVGGALVLLIALSQILKAVGLFPIRTSVEGAVGLSAIFIVGLTAAASTCLAVVGGLLLSVSAKWCEAFHPTTRWEKFQPLLMFNTGRLIGYFLLGGLIGSLGTIIGLSTRGTGILTILIAIVMIVMGLNILKILPKHYCSLPLPHSFSRKIQDLSESKNPFVPGILGALTFFLPCGFTQSMQLLALASGSFLSGGMIMFVFALGTLPALLGISVISSMAEGKFARFFLTFSGALVLTLGAWNLQSGLLLTGVDARGWFQSPASIATGTSNNAVTVNPQGQQIISMYVTDQGYQPDSFVIDAGRPTWIYAVAPNGVFGCASTLTVPAFNLATPVKRGENWLGPIGNPENDFVVTCSMGMFHANVRVRSS
ncbi:MAG: sulfite exporter TauE/SafE family protein [Patescibacteria group bacterium]